MKISNFIYGCVATACVLLTPLATLAADKYPIPEREAGVAWVALGYGAVMLVGVCAVAFKNSKRTHLD